MAWHIHVCVGPTVLETFYELHGFVYLGKHMRFWYFAEGTSRVSDEPAFSRQKNHAREPCTRTAQSSCGVRSRRVHKIYYFGLL